MERLQIIVRKKSIRCEALERLQIFINKEGIEKEKEKKEKGGGLLKFEKRVFDFSWVLTLV